jgi:hypothetical protein
MKVKKLIELLEREDPEMRILVDGYEGGYDDIKIRHAQVRKDVDHYEWNGLYDDVYPIKKVNAVILARN